MPTQIASASVGVSSNNQRGRKGNRNGKLRQAKIGNQTQQSDPSVAASLAPQPLSDTDNATVQGADTIEDAVEGDLDVCFICAEPVKYSAVGQCNHRTCHVCALRLRALYKKTECTFCKVRIFRL